MTHPEPFDLPLTVQPDDIDQLGHVNNVVYLRWVQDVAVAHWQATAAPENRETLVWVVVRHEIDYLRAARPGEAIVAPTRVGTTIDGHVERHTEIRRARNQKVLARTRTLWCPIHRRTGRPTEPRPEVYARFSVPRPPEPHRSGYP